MRKRRLPSPICIYKTTDSGRFVKNKGGPERSDKPSTRTLLHHMVDRVNGERMTEGGDPPSEPPSSMFPAQKKGGKPTIPKVLRRQIVKEKRKKLFPRRLLIRRHGTPVSARTSCGRQGPPSICMQVGGAVVLGSSPTFPPWDPSGHSFVCHTLVYLENFLFLGPAQNLDSLLAQ